MTRALVFLATTLVAASLGVVAQENSTAKQSNSAASQKPAGTLQPAMIGPQGYDDLK